MIYVCPNNIFLIFSKLTVHIHCSSANEIENKRTILIGSSLTRSIIAIIFENRNFASINLEPRSIMDVSQQIAQLNSNRNVLLQI